MMDTEHERKLLKWCQDAIIEAEKRGWTGEAYARLRGPDKYDLIMVVRHPESFDRYLTQADFEMLVAAGIQPV